MLFLPVFGGGVPCAAKGAVNVKADEIGMMVASSKGPEAGAWAIRGDDGSGDALHQRSRDQRARALSDSATVEGEMHGVGARTRSRRRNNIRRILGTR